MMPKNMIFDFALIAIALTTLFSPLMAIAADEMPANAQVKSYGLEWQCDPGFRRNGDICNPIVVPKNARPTNRPYGRGWECYRGFVEADDTECIKIDVPPHAYLVPSGDRWRCSRGYRTVGSSCELVLVPEHGYLNDEGRESTWACDRGYEKSGTTCSEIFLPENAYLTNRQYGAPWMCERGYRASDNECLKVFIPENAYFDDGSYRKGWKCERGFHAIDGTCVPVEVPPNAHINHAGNGWECDRQFSKRSGACSLDN
jgi:hypothetical protein